MEFVERLFKDGRSLLAEGFGCPEDLLFRCGCGKGCSEEQRGGKEFHGDESCDGGVEKVERKEGWERELGCSRNS